MFTLGSFSTSETGWKNTHTTVAWSRAPRSSRPKLTIDVDILDRSTILALSFALDLEKAILDSMS